MNHATKVALAVIALLSPAALAAQQADESGVAAGARVYGDMCGRCHRPRSPLERTDRDWVTIINHMRVRANLTGQQTRAVLEFLQASNGSPTQAAPRAEGAGAPGREPAEFSNAVPNDPATVARGKTLVESKACVGCHVIGTGGGQIGPSLNGVIVRRTAAFVRHKLANPAFNNAISMMPNFGLTSEEMDAIVAYLNTLDGR